ncbi:ATP-binding cassette domain-containing protein [Corynebacterium striatum]|uniref:ATP-binding cassette domain-containing protein n=1 Tax=Corynebacterium striatum TaxID=43770 RepID=UPI0015F0E4DE
MSFELTPGSKLLVTGKSGCGKTTLLNALVGFQKLHSGKVIFRQIDVSKISVRFCQKLLRNKSFVEQPFALNGMTAIEFMEFASA